MYTPTYTKFGESCKSQKKKKKKKIKKKKKKKIFKKKKKKKKKAEQMNMYILIGEKNSNCPR
jgi:hypothetical protein